MGGCCLTGTKARTMMDDRRYSLFLRLRDSLRRAMNFSKRPKRPLMSC